MLGILADLKDDLAAVEGFMDASLECAEPRVAEVLGALDNFHGKMLRPSLLLLVARCFGDIDEGHRRLGAALELIHTATLIHDDMIDVSDQRRGLATAHIRFGNATAVLLGDFFYTRAFHLVSGIGDAELLRLITATTNIICEGELNQMCAQGDTHLGAEEYYRIIYAKTAAMCETAARLGAYHRGGEEALVAARFGKACGLAFQIVDDVLDLVGEVDKVGKTLTNDIERGRLTLPLLRMLELTPADEREALRRLLAEADGEAGVKAVCAEAERRGGIAAAMTEAEAYVAEACRHARGLPTGHGRDQLVELARFITARDH